MEEDQGLSGITRLLHAYVWTYIMKKAWICVKRRYRRKRKLVTPPWLKTLAVCGGLLWVVLLIGLLVSPQPQERHAPQNTAGPLIDIKKAAGAQTIRFYGTELNEVVQMDLEEYVCNVVAAEMPAYYEPEALKAQAVAARTLAVYKRAHGGCNKAKNADICGDFAHCQAYSSALQQREDFGDSYDTLKEKLQSAVDATKGEVITYDGEVIQVFYHAMSGGITEDVQNVFAASLPYLRSVESKEELSYEDRVSVERMSRTQMAQRIAHAYPNASEALGVDILSRYASGRVDEVRVCGIVMKGTQLRTLLALPSTDFTVKEEGEDIVFTCTGYGHGVGMSQVGANLMAQKGKSYREILSRYYLDTRIENH